MREYERALRHRTREVVFGLGGSRSFAGNLIVHLTAAFSDGDVQLGFPYPSELCGG